MYAGVIRNIIWNEQIRGTTRVVHASKNITYRLLNRYGHVMSEVEEHMYTEESVESRYIPGEKERTTENKMERCNPSRLGKVLD